MGVNSVIEGELVLLIICRSIYHCIEQAGHRLGQSPSHCRWRSIAPSGPLKAESPDSLLEDRACGKGNTVFDSWQRQRKDFLHFFICFVCTENSL